MSTITKERLLKIQTWRETYGPGSNVVLPAEEAEELARIALASLEADPVAYMYKDNLHADARFSLHTRFGNWSQEDINEYEITEIPLYAAKPAPVSVPDIAGKLLDILDRHTIELGWGEKPITLAELVTSRDGDEELNACRAAMLQGAEPVTTAYKLPASVIDALEKALQAMSFMGDTLNALDAVYEEDVEYVTPAFEAVREVLESNSPVIPDGWVACSERMPEEDTYNVVADIGSEGNIYCAAAAWFMHGNFSPMDGVSASNYDGGASIEIDMHISHWMPLPSPLQR